MSKAEAEPDGGSLSIPSADGYHYADDHPWHSSDQAALTDDLWDTIDHFREGTEDVPVYSAETIKAVEE